MDFYPDMFDILDHGNDNDNNMTEKQKWTKIEEDFNLNYQIDNTLSNIEGDDEEQEFMDNTSVIIASNNDNKDDEVNIKRKAYFVGPCLLCF
jgi:hypothetical protein